MKYARVCTLILTAILVIAVCAPVAAISLGDVLGTGKAVQSNKNSGDKGKGSNGKSNNEEITIPPWNGPKKRLGVMDMEVKVTATTTVEPTSTGGASSTTSISIAPPSDFGTGLAEMLTTALINSGRFIILERKALGDIQAEQALAAGGSVDPTSAAGAGKLLGAQALIRGAVTEYSYKRSSTGGSASFLKGIGIASTKSEASIALDIRLYDVATGVIMDSVRAEGRAKSSATAIDIDRPDFKVGGSSFNQSPLGAATREAINKAVACICFRMDIIPWEGRIAEIELDPAGGPASLYLNAGLQVGMVVGYKLEVFRPGKAITDPETRTVIGRTKDTILGNCEIKQVTEKLSIAEPYEGQGFQVGDGIRLLNGPKPPTWPKGVIPVSGAPSQPATGSSATSTQPTN